MSRCGNHHCVRLDHVSMMMTMKIRIGSLSFWICWPNRQSKLALREQWHSPTTIPLHLWIVRAKNADSYLERRRDLSDGKETLRSAPFRDRYLNLSCWWTEFRASFNIPVWLEWPWIDHLFSAYIIQIYMGVFRLVPVPGYSLDSSMWSKGKQTALLRVHCVIPCLNWLLSLYVQLFLPVDCLRDLINHEWWLEASLVFDSPWMSFIQVCECRRWHASSRIGILQTALLKSRLLWSIHVLYLMTKISSLVFLHGSWVLIFVSIPNINTYNTCTSNPNKIIHADVIFCSIWIIG